tara:strand:+ start:7517 stop:7813 length:297 start_codon:yes stop_codon:yes gene_type:complete
MTDATLEKNAEETQESNAPSEEETQKVTQYIANDFLARSTLVDALSAVPMDTLVQIVQNQALSRAKETVKNLSEEDFQKILEEALKPKEQPSEETQSE